MYVYVFFPNNLCRATSEAIFVVGFYNPKGEWVPESDHESKEAAAERVHYLNGGVERP
jgi:hypothetical protein